MELQATHFYALLDGVEVCMAPGVLTGTLLIGFDYHFDVCLYYNC